MGSQPSRERHSYPQKKKKKKKKKVAYRRETDTGDEKSNGEGIYFFVCYWFVFGFGVFLYFLYGVPNVWFGGNLPPKKKKKKKKRVAYRRETESGAAHSMGVVID